MLMHGIATGSVWAVAVLMLFPTAGTSEQNPTSQTDCEIVSDSLWLSRHVGETITVVGRYQWDFHYRKISLDGCGDGAILIDLDRDVAAEINKLLEDTYPGILGGALWGVFTGKVVPNTAVGAILRINDVEKLTIRR